MGKCSWFCFRIWRFGKQTREEGLRDSCLERKRPQRRDCGLRIVSASRIAHHVSRITHRVSRIAHHALRLVVHRASCVTHRASRITRCALRTTRFIANNHALRLRLNAPYNPAQAALAIAALIISPTIKPVEATAIAKTGKCIISD